MANIATPAASVTTDQFSAGRLACLGQQSRGSLLLGVQLLAVVLLRGGSGTRLPTTSKETPRFKWGSTWIVSFLTTFRFGGSM